MVPKLPRSKKDVFLLPFGLSLERGRCGAAVKEFSEGYDVHAIKNAPYDYDFIIIASRERMFPLFLALSELCDEPCIGFLVHHLPIPAMAYESDSMTKGEVLDAFKRHAFQLMNDGFITFGISSGEVEIAVGDHKDFEVFCKSSREVTGVLEEFGIPMGLKTSWIEKVEHVHVPTDMLFEDARVRSASEPLPGEEIEKFNADPRRYKTFYIDVLKRLRMGRIDDYAPEKPSHVHPG